MGGYMQGCVCAHVDVLICVSVEECRRKMLETLLITKVNVIFEKNVNVTRDSCKCAERF